MNLDTMIKTFICRRYRMAESIFVGVLMAMVIAAEIFGLWIDSAK